MSQRAVYHSLTNDFGLCYKRIKRVSPYGNSERNIVLRSLYARQMLTLYDSGKTIINIDESWLSVSDFRHHTWQFGKDKVAMNDKTLKIKINMIAAVSNRGQCWLGLTYVNTTEEVFQLFISHLADVLTRSGNVNWRDNTVLLLDGAPYHRSKSTRKYLLDQRITTVLSAPYSY